MEGYLSIREAAEKWGVSERRVNQYCSQGRIPGAERFGGSWAIPEGAEKPGDPRRQRQASPAPAAPKTSDRFLGLMPLMNTPFAPGHCEETIQNMPAGPRREIALAEYHYFSGQAEKAMQETERYLTAEDRAIRLSAGWIFAYSCLTMGRIDHARRALREIQNTLGASGSRAPMAAGHAGLCRLWGGGAAAPAAAGGNAPGSGIPAAAASWPAGLCPVCAGPLPVPEGGVRPQRRGGGSHPVPWGPAAYPIPAIYLHLVAVMDYMSLKQTDRAQTHLLAAWELARPDDLIEAFGEHHGLLGAMLEAAIKPNWPDDFKRIIDITYRFSSGWRRVHNPVTGHDVADDLTTTEFAIAMLAARGWTTQEIAGTPEYFGKYGQSPHFRGHEKASGVQPEGP